MIISSQSHRDYSIVDQKLQELQGKESIQIPVHYAGEMDGEKYFIQIDGHHTLEAARGASIVTGKLYCSLCGFGC